MVDTQGLRETRKAANYGKDKGTWAGAPTTASDTDLVNTSGSPVMVRINGGTFTVVKINGVTVAGLASATSTTDWIPLKEDDILRVTYSVAPTLQWFQQ